MLALGILLGFTENSIVAAWRSGLRFRHLHGGLWQCDGIESHTGKFRVSLCVIFTAFHVDAATVVVQRTSLYCVTDISMRVDLTPRILRECLSEERAFLVI